MFPLYYYYKTVTSISFLLHLLAGTPYILAADPYSSLFTPAFFSVILEFGTEAVCGV